MKAPHYIADFDSTSAMVRALARFLQGRDFPGLGVLPTAPPLVSLLDAITGSERVRKVVYSWGGWKEAIRPDELASIRAEEFSQWVAHLYPERAYPAIMVGSSNGAAIHLCAALGIPWLPQTCLIPVRHPGIHPDEPLQDLEWGIKPGQALLNSNPDLQLHRMHDASQDRLMIRHMSYFRVKRLRLGQAFESFIEERLAPGGTLFILECNYSWPVTRVAERHFFQLGAAGGVTVEEYLQGGERVEEFLKRHGSHRTRWPSPEIDVNMPEAEWGFEPALRDDLEDLARRRRYAIKRISFQEPEDLSHLAADLYEWWYEQQGLEAARLLIESFILMGPWQVLRAALVSFWMLFNVEPSAQRVEKYLEDGRSFDEIYMMLFSHGVDSIGVASLDRWKSILQKARQRGEFIGIAEDKYPKDILTYLRYNRALRQIPETFPMPDFLSLQQFENFLKNNTRYPVVIAG